jgi:hypothetical protein
MTGRKNALEVRETIEADHPEIGITSPLTSMSGMWELRVHDTTTLFNDFWMMVDHLAATFGEIESWPGDDENNDGQPGDRYTEIGIVPDRD